MTQDSGCERVEDVPEGTMSESEVVDVDAGELGCSREKFVVL
jgi:hypothetical protein